jgi:uncharacterized protein (TIGR03083 family)
MGLGREEAIGGLLVEYEAFRDLVRSLDDGQWKTPSRCEGFDTGDVARHVVGTAADVAAGVAGTHTPEEEVEARKGRTPAELADELEGALGVLRGMGQIIDEDAWNGPSPVPDLTMRQGILVLFYDAYVHADDIRTALGMPSVRGMGLDASVEYLAEQLASRGWGPATLALDGMDKFAVGQGDGPTVTGDPLQFVLVATGRADPAPLGLDETVNIYREG